MRITPDNAPELLRLRVPDALSFLIDQHGAALSALAGQILRGIGTAEDVEECVSDVFVHVWNHPDDYDPTRGTVRTWLFILTKSRALDRRRQLRRRARVDMDFRASAPDTVVHQVLSRERQEELVACIEHLDVGVREVIVRRYLLGMSIPEIVEAMQLPRTTVDNRLSRGRRQLRQEWLERNRGGESIDDAE